LLGREGGYGLLIGVDYRVNTYHHVVEMTTGAPCLGRRTVALAIRLPDGRTVEARTWGWRRDSCPINDPARYAPVIARRALERQTTVGNSHLTCFRLKDCFEVIAELLRDGLGEYPPCARCPNRPHAGERTVPSDWDDENQCLRPDSIAWTY
jgi:aminoglycoside N3'-acetyltransferase